MSLVELCEDGDLEEVKAALKRGDDVNTKDEDGWTVGLGEIFKVKIMTRTLAFQCKI